ncbi:MAG: AgmX/PglI C-terminal domain-containing protein [Deltaproteobacteria bacterium]|jgi:outer membrane biosynthesis protein TonB|nr:AgmX/PglI C-terminal domain-containing protein [Deltaproteobacteria bacterium]
MANKLLTILLFSILFILTSCSSTTKSVPDKKHEYESDDSDRAALTTTRTDNVKQEDALELKDREPEENLITEEGFIKKPVKLAESQKQDKTEKKDINRKQTKGRSEGRMAPKVTSVTSFGSVDPNKLRNFMKNNRKQINDCFKTGKSKDANLEGTLKVKLKINSEGKVDSCEITQHLNLESVGNCACNKIKNWNFPAKSKEYYLTYFWKFK